MSKRRRHPSGARRRKPGVGRQRGGIAPLLALAVPALVAAGKAAALGGVSAAASYGTKKVLDIARRGTRAIGSGEDFEDASDEEDNLAVGPVHQLISKIAKISQKGIKRPATPKNPDIKQSPITPDI
ncbi:unnamed protein product, partial [Porites lobata]